MNFKKMTLKNAITGILTNYNCHYNHSLLLLNKNNIWRCNNGENYFEVIFLLCQYLQIKPYNIIKKIYDHPNNCIDKNDKLISIHNDNIQTFIDNLTNIINSEYPKDDEYYNNLTYDNSYNTMNIVVI